MTPKKRIKDAINAGFASDAEVAEYPAGMRGARSTRREGDAERDSAAGLPGGIAEESETGEPVGPQETAGAAQVYSTYESVDEREVQVRAHQWLSRARVAGDANTSLVEAPTFTPQQKQDPPQSVEMMTPDPRYRESMKALEAELFEMRFHQESAQGDVQATVNGYGQLTDLYIDPDAPLGSTAAKLGQRIAQCVDAAQRQGIEFAQSSAEEIERRFENGSRL
ncbi:YbaB/EbfC family nucleoid-associated protein [Actinomadura rugatobispora]|uniref:YbaB/EbfC family nucleoid-associated protein n=1 Tax=Actinomadura rugatobispora TaxID=1994 RepID=A0ABW1A9F5_9ACTN|nr:hypothetical protein GCM10010200_030410 [Actinomadura rugatobispora]